MSRAGRSGRLLLTVAAAIAAAGLLALAMIDARTAASGWLAGFVFWSQIPLGSLALLMIHRLTGGRWGEQLAPALLPAAGATPLLFILMIPVLVAIPTLYPWAHGASGAKPDAVANYLDFPWFTARSLIALAGWSILSFLLPRVGGRPGQLLAGVGLVFHCFIISLIAVDWVLTLEP